ncbi:MAG: prephenate dehydrogenase [Methylomonas sp.]
MFNRICVIGVGLIGGSIASAARAKGLCQEIVAYGQHQNLENLQLAKQLGVIDQFYTDIGEAVSDCDVVIIATPVGTMQAIFEKLKPYWNQQTIYTDAGSTKGSVVTALESVFGAVPSNFILAHPIAGAERSGVAAANPQLFENRRLIITPLVDTETYALNAISDFWQQLGSSVSQMSVEHHDTVLAATSHLPHILAFALVGLLGHKDEQREIFKYAAGGFKDFSRIASSDPTMWQDICLANKHEIIPLIQQFQDELSKIQQLLASDQGAALFETFTYARNARQRFLDQQED